MCKMQTIMRIKFLIYITFKCLIIGAKNVREYWEMLSGYYDGYNKIYNEWSRINNLHKKIVKFINSNLAQKHEFTVNDTLPAYLLGKITIIYDNELNSLLVFTCNIIVSNLKFCFKKKMCVCV